MTPDKHRKDKEFHALFSPFYSITILNTMAKAFTDLYFQALVLKPETGTAGQLSYIIMPHGGDQYLGKLPMFRIMSVTLACNILISIALFYIWLRPMFEYRKALRKMRMETGADISARSAPGMESLKKAIRARLENAYTHLGIFFGVLLCADSAIFILRGAGAENFFFVLLPPLLMVFAAQACFLLGQFNSMMSLSKNTMEMLYSGEELYQLRRGPALSIIAKTSLLVFSFAIIPIALLTVADARGTLAYVTMADISMICVISLLVGISQLFATTQKPIDGLIAKMELVANGNYDQKTRVYFRDEVARLKAGFNTMLEGLKEREEMRNTFGRYVSPEIARELLKNKKVNLGGDEIEAAVLFCDIRDFTPRSERMSPQQVIDFLNGYFDYITRPISGHNGIINKFLGDGIMAVFTPAMGSENYAEDAVRAALGMREALARYNAQRPPQDAVRFGVGLHAGLLIAGNVGTASRTEYTFIGDTVNCASRIESKTKEYATDILISEPLRDLLEGKMDTEVRFGFAGAAQLKGKSISVNLYKVAESVLPPGK
jgi:class 3 adenylate cyclase